MLQGQLSIASTRQMEMIDITATIAKEVSAANIINGICFVYNPHTTAGLTINEGADPAVKDDIIGAMREIIPKKYPYTHAEGNSPAHIMASFMGSSVTVFIENDRLCLGTWQKIFFCEFDGPRTRKVLWKIV